MLKDLNGLRSEHKIWFLVGAVFVCVLLVLIAVFKHDRQKPTSPQGLVAAALTNMFTVKEWQPGMGKRPFMYHPAGFNSVTWRPLPPRAAAGQQRSIGAPLGAPTRGGPVGNTLLYPNAGQTLQPWQP